MSVGQDQFHGTVSRPIFYRQVGPLLYSLTRTRMSYNSVKFIHYEGLNNLWKPTKIIGTFLRILLL